MPIRTAAWARRFRRRFKPPKPTAEFQMLPTNSGVFFLGQHMPYLDKWTIGLAGYEGLILLRVTKNRPTQSWSLLRQQLQVTYQDVIILSPEEQMMAMRAWRERDEYIRWMLYWHEYHSNKAFGRHFKKTPVYFDTEVDFSEVSDE